MNRASQSTEFTVLQWSRIYCDYAIRHVLVSGWNSKDGKQVDARTAQIHYGTLAVIKFHAAHSNVLGMQHERRT